MNLVAMNNLASLLATSPNSGDRDGKRAVELATEAAKLARQTNSGNPYLLYEALDTLAAAEAESGDFAAAVATQREAIEKAAEAQRESLRERLKLYEAAQAVSACGCRGLTGLCAEHVPGVAARDD